MLPTSPARRASPDLDAGVHKRLYDQAARLSRFGAWECDLATDALTWTEGVYAIFDLPPGTRVERAPTVALYEAESRQAMQTMRAEAIRSGRGFSLDARILTARGTRRWMRLTAEVAWAEGRAVRLFGGKQDITHERRLWDALRTLAERDPLTGLWNRGVFDERLAAAAAAGPGEVAAIALVDVDQFKRVNDDFGHAAGDECLRELARRLKTALGDGATVARLGGDEFGLLVAGPRERGDVVRLLSRALRLLCRPVVWKGLPLDLGASIGVALVAPARTQAPADLFSRADEALYAAKAAGRGALRLAGTEGDPTRRPAPGIRLYG